jgi:hypothetical protein
MPESSLLGEWPGGVSPPGSLRTRRERLRSPGSHRPAVGPRAEPPVGEHVGLASEDVAPGTCAPWRGSGGVACTADRAAARTHRPPLPRTQDPLPRDPKIHLPGRLDRRPRQPPPDRSRPTRPRGITAADRRSEDPRPRSPGRGRATREGGLFQWSPAVPALAKPRIAGQRAPAPRRFAEPVPGRSCSAAATRSAGTVHIRCSRR